MLFGKSDGIMHAVDWFPTLRALIGHPGRHEPHRQPG
jgi:hypothetical protein